MGTGRRACLEAHGKYQLIFGFSISKLTHICQILMLHSLILVRLGTASWLAMGMMEAS